MHEIFLSYRRADSQNAAGRLHDHLEVYFGENTVFRDIDRIPAGSNFAEVLAKAIEQCKVVIAVIGRDWLTVVDDTGRVRIRNPKDFVHQEIAAALQSRPVIPVLVSHATMPAREQLPEPLRDLAMRHAVHAPPEREFRHNVRSLAKEIAGLSGLPFTDFWDTLQQCQDAGLTLIKEDFRRDETALDEIEHAKDLLVVQNDGRSWIDQNRERILGRLRDPAKRTRIVLYHPRSQFLPTLVQKNNKGMIRQVAEIKASFDIISRAKHGQGSIELRGHYGFNPYSLLISERYAFLSPYHYLEAGKLPVLKFSAQGRRPLYHALLEDAIGLFEQATPLHEADFDVQPPH